MPILSDITIPQIPHGQSISVLKILWDYSIPLSAASWTSLGLIAWWKRSPPSTWKDAGFDKETFNLMVSMRGATSRFTILSQLASPKHRLALSELTGIDWKETDRQLNLLCQYGLVSIVAEAGVVKMYGLTEQGKLMLELLEKFGRKAEEPLFVPDGTIEP